MRYEFSCDVCRQDFFTDSSTESEAVGFLVNTMSDHLQLSHPGVEMDQAQLNLEVSRYLKVVDTSPI